MTISTNSICSSLLYANNDTILLYILRLVLQHMEGLRCHADGLDNELSELKLRLVEVEYERGEEVERCRGEVGRVRREAAERAEEGERERGKMERETARLQKAVEEVSFCVRRQKKYLRLVPKYNYATLTFRMGQLFPLLGL